MKNALLLVHEFQSMIPPSETPSSTEGYEGFYHLRSLSGNVETCRMIYNIREHDHARFLARKVFMKRVCAYLNQKYGDGSFTLTREDSGFNMQTVLCGHMDLIDKAKNPPHPQFEAEQTVQDSALWDFPARCTNCFKQY